MTKHTPKKGVHHTPAKKAAPPKPPSEWQIKQAKEKAEREAREALEKVALAERVERVEEAFEPDWLKWICEAHESHFEEQFGLTKVEVSQQAPHDYYYFQDNGADILAVAHLDTVIDHARRMCDFVETAAGPMVWSGSLDDRLGAYVILRMLPKLLGEGKFDLLLTVGEESGQSTAMFFDPPEGREYNWGIEFDRGGSDVVMYQYDDAATAKLVRASGARVSKGSFSDIAYLEHVEVKMFNWGVAYRDYHGPRGHAWLDETFEMIGHFLKFYDTHSEDYLPHEKKPYSARGRGRASSSWGGGHQYGNGGWWDDPAPSDEGDEKEVREEFARYLGVKADKTNDAEVWKETLVGKGEWPAGWPAPVEAKTTIKDQHRYGDGQEYLLTDGSVRTAVGYQLLWRKTTWERKQKEDPKWSPANYMSKEEWLAITGSTKEVVVYGGDCEACGCAVIEGLCSERCDLPLFSIYCEDCGRRKMFGQCPVCDLDEECGDCGFRKGWAICRERCGDGESITDAVIDNPTAEDLAFLEAQQRSERLLRVVD